MKRALTALAVLTLTLAVTAPAAAAAAGDTSTPSRSSRSLPKAATLDPGPAGSGVLGDWTANPRTVTTGCQDPAAPVGRRLLLLGDSITARSAVELETRLVAAGWWPCLDYRPGQPTKAALDNYPAGFPAEADVIVMATGSNDIFDPAQLAVQVPRARTLAGSRPLVWVNVYVDRWNVDPAYRVHDLPNSRTVNAYVVNRYGWRFVTSTVDWYGFLVAKASRPTLYLSDGVHTNTAGGAARSALIVSGLAPYLTP